MKKNVAGQKMGIQMTNALDGSAWTSTVICYITLDAGTQTVGSLGSGSMTNEGNGYYTYTPTAAETNGDLVAWTGVAAGAITSTVQTYTTFPQTGDNFTALVLTATERNAIADALLDRNMATGTDSTGRTVRNALRFLRNKWTLSGTTLSVKKEDDTTEAWAAVVTATAGADPITGNDPA